MLSMRIISWDFYGTGQLLALARFHPGQAVEPAAAHITGDALDRIRTRAVAEH